jgi:uncharacterized protein YdeI (BOF family)
LANFGGTMVQHMKDSSLTTTFKDKVNIFGQIIVDTKVNGLTIRCTEKVNLLGLMEKNTLVENLINHRGLCRRQERGLRRI